MRHTSRVRARGHGPMLKLTPSLHGALAAGWPKLAAPFLLHRSHLLRRPHCRKIRLASFHSEALIPLGSVASFPLRDLTDYGCLSADRRLSLSLTPHSISSRQNLLAWPHTLCARIPRLVQAGELCTAGATRLTRAGPPARPSCANCSRPLFLFCFSLRSSFRRFAASNLKRCCLHSKLSRPSRLPALFSLLLPLSPPVHPAPAGTRSSLATLSSSPRS